MNFPLPLLTLILALSVAWPSHGRERPRAAAQCPDVETPGWTPDEAALAAQYEKVSPLTGALDHPARLKRLLAQGHDPNQCIFSSSILSMAITLGRADAVKQLVAAGASANHPLDAIGYSPLMTALGAREYGIADLLLGHGANATLTTPRGTTMMHSLARGLSLREAPSAPTPESDATQLRWARRLLDLGVPADPSDDLGRTPLQSAAAIGRIDLARLLLEHGADPRTKDNRGNSALSYAERRDNTEMVKLLTAGPR